VKYLVAGLGNMGDAYARTRHNIGFMVLDELAGSSGTAFEDRRYGMIARMQAKGRLFVLLKPSTFVNLSGNAVRYWLKKEKLDESSLLVVADDISLPFGTLRMRARGRDAGHNGLAHISQVLGTREYARLRFGIGSEFMPGGQVHYVLGEWTEEEKELLPGRMKTAGEMILSFGLAGVDITMNRYNNR
jgi:PTH1 family peptidyl-tRNA hydrolase